MNISFPTPQRMYIPLDQVEKNIFVFAPLPDDKNHCAFVLSFCIMKNNNNEVVIYPRYWGSDEMQYFLKVTGLGELYNQLIELAKNAQSIDELVGKIGELSNKGLLKIGEMNPNDATSLYDFYDYKSAPIDWCEPNPYENMSLTEWYKKLKSDIDKVEKFMVREYK